MPYLESMTNETETENRAAKTFWLRSESLADSTVAEVVDEFGGRIVTQRNANWQIELSVDAANQINERYGWDLR
jgi:hypothetical protein